MSAEQQTAIQRVTRSKLAIRERQKTALGFRLGGYTFQAIAERMRCSEHTAHRLVEQALTETIREPTENVRKLELERLDSMFAAFWGGAECGCRVSVAVCLKIMEHPGAVAWPVRQPAETKIQLVLRSRIRSQESSGRDSRRRQGDTTHARQPVNRDTFTD
jgi:hypothetical protein